MSFRLVYQGWRSRAAPICLAAGTGLYLGLSKKEELRLEAPPAAQWTSSATSLPRERRDIKVNASGETRISGEGENSNALFGDDDSWAWQAFSNKFSDIGSTITSVKWGQLPDQITNLVVPMWLQTLPEYVRKLQREIDMGPGSLAHDIWAESNDTIINPEITKTAHVTISNDLSPEETAFRERRKIYTRHALAHYLNISVKDIHPEDVPTIAICGSGGGLRALVAGASSYASARKDGLFDCATYTAGVSGSCWLQTLYFSSLGRQNYKSVLKHLKHRLGIHIAFPPAALKLLTSAPTNKFLLSGLIEKAKGDSDADFGLVDIYGVLLGARLLVPKGELEIDPMDLKVSNQRRFIDSGMHPMPLYTMIRHEIPLGKTDSPAEAVPLEMVPDQLKQHITGNSWFSWWEMSPYNVWCEELGAGIPTWSLGRPFQKGVSLARENGYALPELRVPTLFGIWGSAFCATLSHYYKEIRPVISGIAGFGGLDNLLTGRNDDLIKVHPIDAASIPNFALGLEGQLPSTCPKSIFDQSHLKLMDAGMSNNLPIYPLLRPGRDIDILIAFDASADIKSENWLSVADGYAKQRGIKGWPVGIGWPKGGSPKEQTAKELDEAQAATAEEAANLLAKAKKEDNSSQDQDLGYCTVWIGSATESTPEPPSQSSTSPPPQQQPPQQSSQITTPSTSNWDLSTSTTPSGLAVIYFPLLANPSVPGIDPEKSDFMSTWNFIYTAEEIDAVSALAQANFDEGKEQTRRCVRAVYERKKKLREEREEWERKEGWRRVWRGQGDLFR